MDPTTADDLLRGAGDGWHRGKKVMPADGQAAWQPSGPAKARTLTRRPDKDGRGPAAVLLRACDSRVLAATAIP
jgi:hypothetical protein